MRLRNQPAIGMFDRVAHLRTVGVVDEIAERMVPKLIGRAMLVQNPEHLVRVWNQVSRKAQTDEPVDTRARYFGNIDQTARQNVIENLFGWIPLEGNRENFRFVSRVAEGIAQAFGVNLCAPANEGNLDRGNEDSHGRAFRPTIA